MTEPVSDLSQKKYWNKKPEFRDIQHSIVKFFSEQRWQYISHFLNLNTIKTVLDLGCGEGISTIYAPDHWSVFGLDTSVPMLMNNPSKNKVCSNAYSLPFPPSCFDMVYSWELLHHVNNPSKVVKEMKRVTKKYILIFEPNPMNPVQLIFSYLDQQHKWVRRNFTSHLLSIISGNDLKIHLFRQAGCIFPNKTPEWFFHFLKLIPFWLPIFGISHAIILEKSK